MRPEDEYQIEQARKDAFEKIRRLVSGSGDYVSVGYTDAERFMAALEKLIDAKIEAALAPLRD